MEKDEDQSTSLRYTIEQERWAYDYKGYIVQRYCGGHPRQESPPETRHLSRRSQAHQEVKNQA